MKTIKLIIIASAAFTLLLVSYTGSNAQTILPPIINCVTTDQHTGDVRIYWTLPPLDPCGPFVAYVLLGATNVNGPYLSIDTITDMMQVAFLHLGANAAVLDWYYFMITLQNCPGATSISSDTIKEEVLITPEIDFVTVTPMGVQFNWIPNTSSQTAGYLIYYKDDNGFALRIDTVYGRSSDTYIDLNPLPGFNPNAGAVAYTIAAFDECSNLTVFNDSFHRTIFLTVSFQSPPLSLIALNWTPYINWPEIASYDVEVGIDGGNFTVEEHLPDGSFAYTYSTAGITGDSICFRISAVRQGDSTISSSNQVCFSRLIFSSVEVDADNAVASLHVYPNPFSASATIEYTLSKSKDVSLTVYDVLGRVVVENPAIRQLGGEYSISFAPPSGKGVFVVELNVGGMKTRKRVVSAE